MKKKMYLKNLNQNFPLCPADTNCSPEIPSQKIQSKRDHQMSWLRKAIFRLFRARPNIASAYEIETRIRKLKDEQFSKNYRPHI